MAQRYPHTGTDGSEWLSNLVETFGHVELLSHVPCDAATQTSLLSRLNQPASAGLSKMSRRHQSAPELQH